jgi:predicted amidohydrolase
LDSDGSQEKVPCGPGEPDGIDIVHDSIRYPINAPEVLPFITCWIIRRISPVPEKRDFRKLRIGLKRAVSIEAMYNPSPMRTFRIALANIRYPISREGSVVLAEAAIEEARKHQAGLICFPECFVPGYRAKGKNVAPPDQAFLDRAWSIIAGAAAKARLAVILGTERFVDGHLFLTALVINRDGTFAGFQDKVQLDPSEEGMYSFGSSRQIFTTDSLTFGIVICHEGWRYPETVRWAARRGAHIIFHPHFHEAEPGSYVPSTFADAANSFFEKAALCRAAENTCYFATVNYASAASPTTSAIVCPDGTLLCYQPYGKDGLLIADIDPALATGLLASRCRYS